MVQDFDKESSSRATTLSTPKEKIGLTNEESTERTDEMRGVARKMGSSRIMKNKK